MSTAPAETDEPRPLSLPRLVVQWYSDHPGLHRCRDVTAALQADGHVIDNSQVANFSRRAAAKGDLVRIRAPRPAPGQGQMTVYGAPTRTVSPPEETARP